MLRLVMGASETKPTKSETEVGLTVVVVPSFKVIVTGEPACSASESLVLKKFPPMPYTFPLVIVTVKTELAVALLSKLPLR